MISRISKNANVYNSCYFKKPNREVKRAKIDFIPIQEWNKNKFYFIKISETVAQKRPSFYIISLSF